jgi:chromosome segregation ATPase
MVSTGYEGFERGKMGSTTEHLTVLEYKTQQSKEKLNVIEGNLAEKEETLETLTAKVEDFEQIVGRADELHRMARFNDKGLVEMSETSFDKLMNFAKEGLYSRKKIETLKSQIADLQGMFNLLMGEYRKLYDQTKGYITALKLAPQQVKEFISDILETFKDKTEIMLGMPMPQLFQGWKSKNTRDMNKGRSRDR